MNYLILLALGREEFDAIEAGRIFDLISEVETAGTTHSLEVIKEPFYLQAIKDWQSIPERRKQDHLASQQRRLKRLLLSRLKEMKNGRKQNQSSRN
jgi:hypothetical protein